MLSISWRENHQKFYVLKKHYPRGIAKQTSTIVLDKHAIFDRTCPGIVVAIVLDILWMLINHDGLALLQYFVRHNSM